MATLAELVVKIGADIDNYERNMTKVQKSLHTIGDRMQSVGSTVGTAFTAAGVAVGAGLGMAVKTAADFDAQMSRVGAISGATKGEFQKLRKSALDLGASTSKSASEVAKGQEVLAALGFTAKDIIGAMPGVISAAEASGADMAKTAEVMASALNIFGLEASEANRVADVLAQTANQSAADIGDMSYALKYAGPVAANLGVSIEELSASIGIMTDAGLDGSSAGTALRAGLLSLLKPSEQNSKLMDRLGITMEDANGKFVGIDGVIGGLNTALSGMTDAQKTATLASLVGTEASSGFLALMSAGPEEINKMTTALENSGGASKEAADKMKNNLKGALEEMGGAFETMQISIGTALTPAIKTATEAIQGLADWFNNLSPTTQKFIAIGAAITAILLVLVGVVGFLVAALGMLVMVEWAVIAPILGIIAAVAAVIAIVVALAAIIYMNWDKIKSKTEEVWGAVKDWLSNTWDSIKKVASDTWNAIEKAASATWNAIKDAAISIWNGLKTGVIAIITPMVDNATALFNGMKDGLTKIMDGLKLFFTSVWTIIKNIFLGAVLLIVDLVTGDFEGMKEHAKQIMNNLSKALGGVWEGIKKIFNGAVEAVKGYVSAGWDIIKTTTSNIFNAIKNALSQKWSEIQSNASSSVENMKNAVRTKFESMKNAVAEKMAAVKAKVEEMWNKAQDFLKNIDLKQIGMDIIKGLISGIDAMATKVWEKVTSIADGIKKSLTKALDIHSPSRVAVWIMEMFGKGMVIGADNSLNSIAAAAGRLATAAIPELSGGRMSGISANSQSGGARGGITQQITIHSPTPLTPSEIARKNLQVSRQLAMEWGV